MTLDKPDVIDLVSVQGDTVTLHLVVTGPWASNGSDAMLLQAKLKSYVAFAADGQLMRQYPDAQGKKVLIEIRSSHPLSDTELRLVEAARRHWCEPDGISLLVSVVGPGRV
jgi:hypothetical protein